MSKISLAEHIDGICQEAGLAVMIGVFDVLLDREELSKKQLRSLTAEDVTNFYEGYIGPAIDTIERHIQDPT